MIGIYKITNKITKKSYIGQSVDIKKRWEQHLKNIGSNKNPMYIDFKKYGTENFLFEIIEECSEEELNEKEMYWIKYFNTYNVGYNLTIGGESIRRNPYAEQEKTSKTIFMPLVFDNYIKLYGYLVTISGFSIFSDNLKTFKQKNLILTDIKNKTSLADKTVKLYLYYLEELNLIVYKGEAQFNFLKEEDFSSSAEYHGAILKEACSTWKERQKEKNSDYYINQPNTYVPISELTFLYLTEKANIDNLQLGLYLYLYRNNLKENLDKEITYEKIRDAFSLKKHTDTHKHIYNALCALQNYGLIKFTPQSTRNSKGAEIPAFKITEVNYYPKDF